MATETGGLTDRLWHTDDGGRTWADATPRGINPPGITLLNRSSDSLSGMAFVSGDAAWAPIDLASPATSNIHDEVDTIYRTRDSGRTWTEVAKVSGGGSSLSFLDTSVGVDEVFEGAAAGSSAMRLLVTHDGGSRWTEVAHADPDSASSGLGFGCDKGEVGVQTATRWWLPLECNTNLPHLVRTLDGGRSWHSVELPASSGMSFSGQAWWTTTPLFLGTDHVVEEIDDIATPGSGLAEVSSDGGDTWRAVKLPVGAAQHVDYITAMDWVAFAETLKTTHDGGRHWENVTPNVSLAEATIDFATPTVGWAVSGGSLAGSRFLVTRDGGRTWQLLPVPQ